MIADGRGDTYAWVRKMALEKAFRHILPSVGLL